MKNDRYIIAGISALCLLLIIVTSVNSSFLMPLRSGAGFFLVPMEKGVNAVGSGLFGNIQAYSDLRDAQEENARLNERVANLTEENNRLSSETYELERLRELYKLDQEYMNYPKVAARVIAKDSGNWFQVFRIDKGASDGIRADMNVIANGGLIGIVTDVGQNYATVRAIIDDDSNVSAMSQRTGETCNVSGSMELFEDGRLGLDHVRKDADIAEGDRIVTSNISDVYLPGLFIGYASALSTDSNNVTKSGTVIPVGQFDNIREVLIITKLKGEEMQNQDDSDAKRSASEHNDVPQEETQAETEPVIDPIAERKTEKASETSEESSSSGETAEEETGSNG